MIPVHEADSPSRKSIPRESGDDPFSYNPMGLANEYSPRERG